MASVLDDPVLERQFKGHHETITCVDFSPNNKQLASGSVDKYLMIWNLASKSRVLRLVGHQDAITGVQFSPSGHLVATSSLDRTVRLWKPNLNGESTVFKAHTAAVRSVAFSHDGHQLVTASDDKSIKVWCVPRRCFLYSLNEHTNWVRCARFSPDGRLVASCGDDRSIRLWDTSSKRCINSFTDCKGSSTFIDFNFSGTCLAASGSDSSVNIWDLRTNKLIQRYQVHSAGINSFSFHPSSNYLISGSTDSTVKILDLLEGRLIYTLHGHKGAVITVSFSRDGELFASGGVDRQVLVWRTNFDSKPYRDLLKNHAGRLTQVPRPYLSDIHPRMPYRGASHPAHIQVNPTVADTRSKDPNITDMLWARNGGPESWHSALNGRIHLPPTKSATNGHHSNFSRPCDSPWMGGETAGRAGSSAGNLSGKGKRHEEKAETKQAWPPDAPPGHRLNVNAIMEQIVHQLGVLTQTVSVLEERLTLTEDKLSECVLHQTQILQASDMRRSMGSRGANGSSDPFT